jgi:hypothetical protein
MVDGGVIASRFEEEAVSRRRIWDRSVDESRGRVATVCVDILRIDIGAPEKNERVYCVQRVLLYVSNHRTEVHVLMCYGGCCYCCFASKNLVGSEVANFHPSTPQTLSQHHYSRSCCALVIIVELYWYYQI